MEGPIGGGGVVEMDSGGDHLLEEFCWRLDVMNAVFYRPRPVAGEVDTLLYCDGEILVPGDRPVFFGRLIKEKAPDGGGWRFPSGR